MHRLLMYPSSLLQVRIQLGQGSAFKVATDMLAKEGVGAFYNVSRKHKDVYCMFIACQNELTLQRSNAGKCHVEVAAPEEEELAINLCLQQT